MKKLALKSLSLANNSILSTNEKRQVVGGFTCSACCMDYYSTIGIDCGGLYTA